MKTTNTLANVQLNETIEQLEQLLFCDLVTTYNDFAEVNHYERIFDNDEENLNNIFLTPYDAIMQTNHKDYKDNENYFTFNGYGHVVSFDYRLSDNSPIDIEELAQWIVDNDLFNNYDIEVTTLDDMLASIEDNITDDKYILSKLADYLGQSLGAEQAEKLKTDDEYCAYLVNNFIGQIDDYNFDDLYDLINTVGINYE